MELKYIILTIIKILISVPTILMDNQSHGPAVIDTGANMTAAITANTTDIFEFKFDLSDDEKSQQDDNVNSNETVSLPQSSISEVNTLEDRQPAVHDISEQIPDPSALVVPGYNLPESIFNKGKPFYLERDPITGSIDFANKPAPPKLYDEYIDEYIDDDGAQANYDIHDKANINRKDSGNAASHKPSDINQLTPNFHDFLNLPVKYSGDKYVYPLISSSYANTKVQGNVNKIHNHKDYSITTYKPNYNPTFYATTSYFGSTKLVTTQKPIVVSKKSTLGTEKILLKSPMNGQNVKTTTKKTMSLFEQLFGDYDEEVTTTVALTEPTTIKHEIYNGNKITNGHMAPAQEENILTGSNMAYEYEDDYPSTGDSDNVTVVTKKMPLLIRVTTPKESQSTTTKKSHYQVSEVDFQDGVDVAKHDIDNNTTKPAFTTSDNSQNDRVVTSLPIGDNHVTHGRPIIVATQNLRAQLANERVEGAKPFGKVPHQNNVLIGPDQDTVSFVVGHRQNVASISAGGGEYQGTALKESPYDSNPFRPVYEVQTPTQENIIQVQSDGKAEVYYQKNPAGGDEKEILSGGGGEGDKSHAQQAGSSATIQPIRSSETNLAIGDPIKVKPAGQVVDDQIEINEETIEFPKGTGPKIIFPDDKAPTTYSPPHHHQHHHLISNQPNRDQILQLNSKPMYHQLPSDLTPPREQSIVVKPAKLDRVRPPWDPRPGHFHQGRPEYARPPRPPQTAANNEIYKRIDTLPNILPQFRPNGHHHHGGGGVRPPPHHHHRISNHGHKTSYVRQPLLERPSNNRPIGFFEKLHPPPQQQIVAVVPPSPPKSLQSMRKVPALDNELKLRQQQAEDRIMNLHMNANGNVQHQEPLFGFLTAPPKVVVPNNRRNGLATADGPAVETLQMIQAKLTDRKEENSTKTVVQANMNGKDKLERPLYVVYPVNTAPVKLDAVHDIKQESIVIGTRAELPLPPNKITTDKEFNFEQSDRHDSPILKPHPRPPTTYPIKSDFPYPLERPDPSVLNPPVPDSPNNLDTTQDRLPSDDVPNFVLSNQWNTIDKTQQNDKMNQISATLKTFTTDKPIAVAYTPTEPSADALPNYAELMRRPSNEFTVSAVMHAHHQNVDMATQHMAFIGQNQQLAAKQRPAVMVDDLLDDDQQLDPAHNRIAQQQQQEFQAPFLASANLDAADRAASHGWAVINRSADKDDNTGTTVAPLATTREFDIENFKPQLEGGFKPIYSYAEGGEGDGRGKGGDVHMNERQEK